MPAAKNKVSRQRWPIFKTAATAVWLAAAAGSLYLFFRSESSRLLEAIIGFTAVWSIYLALTKRLELAIILTGFLATTALFDLVDLGTLSSPLASLIFIILFSFLFYLFHFGEALVPENLKNHQTKIYAGLCLLLTAEFFMALKFFPIDAKNKSILIILFFWYINQIFHFQSLKKLTAGIAINLTLVFLIMLTAILYTLPFLGR